VCPAQTQSAGRVFKAENLPAPQVKVHLDHEELVTLARLKLDFEGGTSKEFINE